MAANNGYGQYQQAPPGAANPSHEMGPSRQGYSYGDSAPYIQESNTANPYIAGPDQQYAWVRTQASGYPVAREIKNEYDYDTGSRFPVEQRMSNESNFRASAGPGSYRKGQPSGGSRRTSSQMNTSTNVYSPVMPSMEPSSRTSASSGTAVGYPALSNAPGPQVGQGAHNRIVTLQCSHCGGVYSQGNMQATMHQYPICGSCNQDPTMRSSHANGPSSASTIIPSTITGGDSFAPGIAPSNPSSARGSLEPSPTVVQCSECGKTLTGSYASGNLTRHQKSKQCAASKNRKVFVCGIDGCPNQYERSDALLNHKRKKHDHPGPSKKL